ncbi:chaperone J-domain-containing protein [Linderina pennispora]|uniref:Chaperone J-domain-containing protein n=1 Tax=Linderina pennispora TaxID=61395 RepID=A0A1Y1WEY4_9FUNG|nr:chaperone J-domain-containing protein [Linderina pennispora]ORX71888.1 chaperone J-domain-containing protein [Linderina pennispora]
MRIKFVLLAFLALKIDHEIFELYDSLLGIEPKASLKEINRAYRKLSMKYHPDKRKQSAKKLTEADTKRFERMGLVVGVLRDSYARERYDFFRKNGVPMWRGTGYMYSRWRPGFGSVVTGLVVFVSAMQYLFQKLSFWRAQERIKALEEEQRKRGGRVKVRVMRRQQRGSPPTTDYEDSGFEGNNDELDANQINTASAGSWLLRLPVWVAKTVLGARRTMDDDEVVVSGGSETTADGRSGKDILQQVAGDALAAQNANDMDSKDLEARVKKASNKAKKLEARRRRMPVV